MRIEAVHTFIMAVFTATAFWVGSSVSELNKNMAVVITKLEAHETRIIKLEGK